MRKGMFVIQVKYSSCPDYTKWHFTALTLKQKYPNDAVSHAGFSCQCELETGADASESADVKRRRAGRKSVIMWNQTSFFCRKEPDGQACLDTLSARCKLLSGMSAHQNGRRKCQPLTNAWINTAVGSLPQKTSGVFRFVKATNVVKRLPAWLLSFVSFRICIHTQVSCFTALQSPAALI